MKKYPFSAFLLALIFVTYFSVTQVSLGQNINPLDQWKSDGTNITQRTASKPVKITGLGTSLTVCTDTNGVLTTTGCPSGGGGGGSGGTMATSTYGGGSNQLQYPSPSTIKLTSLDSNNASTTKWLWDGIQNIQSIFGKVGIGTTTPYAPLSVVGQIVGEYFTATSTTATSVFNGLVSIIGSFKLPSLTQGSLYVGSAGAVNSVSTSTPTVSTGLSYSGTMGSLLGGVSGNLTVNTSQNIATLSNLTSNGAILTSGGVGTLGVYTGTSCTNQFVRSLSGSIVATCATVGAADVSLANLTATNGTLTFSGTYDGSTARTIGLNLGNANTWSVLQTFNYSSSTAYSSFVTASSTNLFAGSFTLATSSAGCASFTSAGLLFSTGTACGSGSGGGGGNDGFTHPLAGQSATTSLMLLSGNASTTQLSAGKAYFGATATTTIDGTGNVTLPTSAVLTLPLGSVSTPSFTFSGDTNTGIYSQGADSLDFDTGGVWRFGITSEGLVATGTSTPANTTVFTVASSSPVIDLDDTNAAVGTKHAIISNNDGTINIGQMQDANYQATTSLLSIQSATNVQMGIGTTTPFGTLSVQTPTGFVGDQFNVGSSSKNAFRIDGASHIFIPNITVATAGSNQTVCFKAGGELIDETTTACAVSSAEFKENIKSLSVDPLSTLMRLHPVSFSYKPEYDVAYDYKDTDYGFIAEEVAQVDPHLAEYGVNGKPRNLDDRAILSVVVKAVQELASKGTKSAWDGKQNVAIILLLGYVVYNEVSKRKKK